MFRNRIREELISARLASLPLRRLAILSSQLRFPSFLFIIVFSVSLLAGMAARLVMGPSDQTTERLGQGQLAAHVLTLSMPRAGLVKDILVEPGKRVAAGDVLARLDGRVLALRLSAMKARQASLMDRRRIETVESDALRAERDSILETLRLARLFKDTGLTEDRDVDTVQRILAVRNAVIARHHKRMRELEAEINDVDKTLRALENAIKADNITASFAAIVTAVWARPDILLDSGHPLFQLANIHDAKITVLISPTASVPSQSFWHARIQLASNHVSETAMMMLISQANQSLVQDPLLRKAALPLSPGVASWLLSRSQPGAIVDLYLAAIPQLSSPRAERKQVISPQ